MLVSSSSRLVLLRCAKVVDDGALVVLAVVPHHLRGRESGNAEGNFRSAPSSQQGRGENARRAAVDVCTLPADAPAPGGRGSGRGAGWCRATRGSGASRSSTGTKPRPEAGAGAGAGAEKAEETNAIQQQRHSPRFLQLTPHSAAAEGQNPTGIPRIHYRISVCPCVSVCPRVRIHRTALSASKCVKQ